MIAMLTEIPLGRRARNSSQCSRWTTAHKGLLCSSRSSRSNKAKVAWLKVHSETVTGHITPQIIASLWSPSIAEICAGITSDIPTIHKWKWPFHKGHNKTLEHPQREIYKLINWKLHSIGDSPVDVFHLTRFNEYSLTKWNKIFIEVTECYTFEI